MYLKKLLGNFPLQCILCVSDLLVIAVNIFLQAAFPPKKYMLSIF